MLIKAHTGTSFLLVLGSALLLSSFGLVQQFSRKPPPRAVGGRLDLSQWEKDSVPVVPLNGEWTFYPGSVYNGPDSLKGQQARYLSVPGFWSSPQIPQNHRRGTAVFELEVLLPENQKGFSLEISDIRPNYELWINGSFLTAAGVVSGDSALSQAGNRIFFDTIPCPAGKAEIIITISNFHSISAGINHEILMGDYRSLMQHHSKVLIRESSTLGAILLMAFYSFSLFLLDDTKKDCLFFSMICFSAFLYAGLENQMVLTRLFPFIGGEVRSKILYLLLNNIGMIIFIYFRSFSKSAFLNSTNPYILGYGGVSSLLILVSPMSVYSLFTLPIELINIGIILLVLFHGVQQARQEKTAKSILTPVVILVLLLSIAAGICNESLLISSYSHSANFLVALGAIILLKVRDYSGNLRQIEALEISREELNRVNRELLTISHVDGLTGIANRRRFDQHLLNLWQTERLTDNNIGLIMIDIDYFKNYNDYYGHQQGDACLIRVAEGLRHALMRQNDFIARYGGEEFAVVLSGMDREGVYRVAENMRWSIEELTIRHEGSLCHHCVTVSLGCAVLSGKEGVNRADLILQADKALYQAKDSGRNCSVLYSPPESPKKSGPPARLLKNQKDSRPQAPRSDERPPC